MRNKQSFTPEEQEKMVNEARMPSALRMAGNFTKAVVKHVGDGMRKVDLTTYQERLDICNDCQLRLKNRCTHESCGCFIDKKAWWASESCPLGKWPNDT